MFLPTPVAEIATLQMLQLLSKIMFLTCRTPYNCYGVFNNYLVILGAS